MATTLERPHVRRLRRPTPTAAAQPRALVLVGPALFLAGWCLLAVLLRDSVPRVMPAPWSVAASIGSAWREGLGGNILSSAKIAAGGWLVGSAVAVVVGIVVGSVRTLRVSVVPVIELLRPVSALAWVPLAVIWFGIGYSSKLFVVALATFFAAIVHVLQGAHAVEARQLKAARMLSLRRRDVYRFVALPAAMPEISVGLRQGLGVAWGGVIIAELVAGDQGLGAMELKAQQSFQLNVLVVAMVTFAVLGLASVLVYGVLERLAFPWLPAQRSGARATADVVPALLVGGRGSALRRVLGPVVGIVAFVAAWWAAAAWAGTSAVVLPQPSDVAQRLGDLLQQGSFWRDFGISLREFVTGYAIAMASALVLSVAFVTVPALHRALWSEIELLRFVIPFSWIPLAVLWFSTAETGKTFIVGYAVFFSVILPTYAALARVDVLLLKAGRMAGLPWWRLVLQVRVPAALPGLLAAARVGVGAGWIAVIAAEYVGAQGGLGVLITNAQETLDTKTVMAGMIMIGVTGAVLSAAIRGCDAALTRRRGGQR